MATTLLSSRCSAALIATSSTSHLFPSNQSSVRCFHTSSASTSLSSLCATSFSTHPFSSSFPSSSSSSLSTSSTSHCSSSSCVPSSLCANRSSSSLLHPVSIVSSPMRSMWTYRFVEHIPIHPTHPRWIPRFPPSHFKKVRAQRFEAKRAAYTPPDSPILVEHKNISMPSLVSSSTLAPPHITNSEVTLPKPSKLSVAAKTILDERKRHLINKNTFGPFEAPANVFVVIQTPGKQLKILESDVFMTTAAAFRKEVGTSMVLEKVMVVGARDFTVLGRPYIPNVKVHVTVEEHVKTKHQLIFKKKRRKGYRRVYGFRTTAHIVRVDRIELPSDLAAYAQQLGVTTRTEEDVMIMKGIAVQDAQAQQLSNQPVENEQSQQQS